MASVEFKCDFSGSTALLLKEDNNFFTARDANEADSTQESTVFIGQIYNDPKYSTYRGVFCWDTSGLDNGCLITSATVTLYVLSGSNEITAIVKSGMATYPHIPPVVGDYDLDHYSGNGGEIEEYQHGVITLNSTGRDWINKKGYTKFAILCKNDIDGIAPSGSEAIYVYGYAAGSNETKRPKLTVNYVLPTGSPSVSTIDTSCTDRQSTTITAIGDITDAGGGYEARGFEYYEKSSIAYLSSMYAVREILNDDTTGQYEMTINGLKPETTYYVRAWVRNAYGLVYGDWVECTTTAVPSYDIYTDSNDANYSLYVSDDEAIAWQGYRGPYNGKQTNINVTDLTNKTPGVKVLKIDPDAKGTFHITITVKQEIKS